MIFGKKMNVTGYFLKKEEQTDKQHTMMLQTQSILSGSFSRDDSYSRRENGKKGSNKNRDFEDSYSDLKLVLNAESGIYFIHLSNIIRIESSNNYCFVHLTSGQSLFISKPLKSFEISLQNCGFFRIHNSHLINLNYLEKLTKDGGYYAIMVDGNRLPISRRKLPEFMIHIKKCGTFIF